MVIPTDFADVVRRGFAPAKLIVGLWKVVDRNGSFDVLIGRVIWYRRYQTGIEAETV